MTEEEHSAAQREIAHDAFLELRDTIAPGFDPIAQGYNSPDHARFTIITLAARRSDALAKKFLALSSRSKGTIS